MKTTSYRARALACALLATTATCGLTAAPAHAQSNADQPAPPRALNLDTNGVDLVSGKFNWSSSEVTIGGEGGGLAYSRNRREQGYDDQYVTALNSDGTTISVSMGVATDTFAAGGGNSSAGTGATLTLVGSDYRYTTRDGTIYQFSSSVANGGYRPAQQRVTSITFSDGRVVTIEYDHGVYELCKSTTGECFGSYDVTRPAVVSSTDGYRLVFRYLTDDPGTSTTGQLHRWMTIASATASNTAEEYCTTANCPPTGGTWRSANYAWNGTSTEETRTDAMGRVTTLTVVNGQITGIRPPGATANRVSLTYDSVGRVATFTLGNDVWTYGYSDSGDIRTTTVTSPTGLVRTVKSSLSKGKVLEDKTGTGGNTVYEYDNEGRLTKATSPEGDYTTYSYDSRDNVTSMVTTPKPGSSLAPISVSASYPATCGNVLTCNKPTSTVDPRGNVTDYSYDATHGGLLSVTSPAPVSGGVRPQRRFSYAQKYAWYKDASGVLVQAPSPIWKLVSVSECASGSAPSCVGTADETRTEIDYGASNAPNNLLAAKVTMRSGNSSGTGAVSAVTALSRDRYGNVIAVDGPLSGTADTSHFRYNAGRELIGTVSPDPDGTGALKPRAARTTLDAEGQVTKVERGTVNSPSDADWASFASLEAMETGYDAVGRPETSRLTANGTTYALTQTGYDGDGRPQCTAVRMNPSEYGSLPGACQQDNQGSFGPDRISKTLYGSDGRPEQVRSAVGTADEAAEATASYTDNGQTRFLIDAKGNRSEFRYDGHDRLARQLYPQPSGPSSFDDASPAAALATAGAVNENDYEELGYDAGSNVTSFRNRAGEVVGLSYDVLSRPTSKDRPGSEPDVSYGYDLLGRLKTASQSGHSLSFTYDSLGRNLTQVGPHGTVSSAWDIGGRRTKLTYPDGFVVDHTYLVTGEMKTIQQPNSLLFGSPTVLVTFGYDNLGRRTSLSRLNGATTSYSYDPVSRLSQLVQNPYGTTHDLTLGFSYNPASQIISNTRSNDTYAWGGHGSGTTNSPANGLNQIVSQDGASIGHDAKGNMLNDPTTGYTFSYSSENLLKSGGGGVLNYDPLMRLYEAGTVGKSRFVYDGDTRIAEYYSSGAQTYRFVHGPSVDEPLIEYSGSNLATRTFLHADERGSIIAGSDNNGNVTYVGRYDEYGKPGPTNYSRFGFTGYPYETLTELYYARARMYNPRTGVRFMQPDPLGYGDGMNMYPYVGGDPVNFIDPTGTARLICNKVSVYIDYGQPPPPPTEKCYWEYDPSDYLFLFGNPSRGRPFDYWRDVATPAAEKVRKKAKEHVQAARCLLGKGGVLIEEGGAKTSEFGVGLVGVGAVFMGAGAVSAQPEVVAGGAAISSAGAAVAGYGGLVALGGAGLRAVGGDYNSAITRGAINIISRLLPIPREPRAVGTNSANQATRDKSKGVPACAK